MERTSSGAPARADMGCLQRALRVVAGLGLIGIAKAESCRALPHDSVAPRLVADLGVHRYIQAQPRDDIRGICLATAVLFEGTAADGGLVDFYVNAPGAAGLEPPRESFAEVLCAKDPVGKKRLARQVEKSNVFPRITSRKDAGSVVYNPRDVEVGAVINQVPFPNAVCDLREGGNPAFCSLFGIEDGPTPPEVAALTAALQRSEEAGATGLAVPSRIFGDARQWGGIDKERAYDKFVEQGYVVAELSLSHLHSDINLTLALPPNKKLRDTVAEYARCHPGVVYARFPSPEAEAAWHAARSHSSSGRPSALGGLGPVGVIMSLVVAAGGAVALWSCSGPGAARANAPASRAAQGPGRRAAQRITVESRG